MLVKKFHLSYHNMVSLLWSLKLSSYTLIDPLKEPLHLPILVTKPFNKNLRSEPLRPIALKP